MSRRIDGLYCSKDTASQQIKAIIQDISKHAAKARREVEEAVAELVQALKSRESDLIVEIDALKNEKIRKLEKQLISIESGQCPPAPSEDPEKEPDPNVHLLDTDSMISFRMSDEDFMPKLQGFGCINDESTYASKSFAKGPALGIMKMDNPSYLWVFACNRIGERRKQGGDVVSCKLSSDKDFDNVEVEDLKDGRYRMKFVPRQAGSYLLHITAGPEDNAEEIQGSPFKLVVRAPTNYALLGGVAGAEEPEGKARIGEAGEKEKANSLGTISRPLGLDFDHSGRYLFVVDQSNHRIQVFDTHQGHEAVCTFGKRGFGQTDMDTPHAVCADRDNRVVVSDVLNHRLQILEFQPRNKKFRHLCTLGGPGSGPGQFQFPKGLSMTENGHLLVCDFGNHRIQAFDTADGFSFIREWGVKGSDEGQFESPLDITVNCNGEFLVSDMNNRIQIFDNQGKFLRGFGRPGRKDGEFNYPVSLVTNDENALFVCDQGNRRMQVFHASDGQFIHKWGGSKKKKKAEDDPTEEEGEKKDEWIGIRQPAGVAVNADGTVIVADYKLNAIFAF